jgi:hypothetical protein
MVLQELPLRGDDVGGRSAMLAGIGAVDRVPSAIGHVLIEDQQRSISHTDLTNRRSAAFTVRRTKPDLA